MVHHQSRIESIETLQQEIEDRGQLHCFSSKELERLKRPNAIRSLCARYLAKTMIHQALHWDVSMTEISIENNRLGAPDLQFLSAKAEQCIQASGVRKIHLSFSHTKEYVGVLLIIDYF
jgi:phosphopantetheinyl transferase (holo-ACP synthase)